MLKDTLSMSERLACRAVGLARSTYRRLPMATTLADPDADLRAWLRAYATKHPCHGFRRAWAALRHDEGRVINVKKVHRLWCAEGLQRRVHSPRKRAGTSSAPPEVIADAPKVVWAMDFQFDSTTDGKAVKIASMVDEHTRESLLHLVERSITAERLVAELEKVFATAGGPPKVLRMDNGPELVSQALQRFCENKVGMSYIPPGTPWNNGYIESFNNRLRKECLNRNHWSTLFEARVVIGDFKHEHNTRHRHSAWATAHRPSTLRPARMTTTPWPARSTESRTTTTWLYNRVDSISGTRHWPIHPVRYATTVSIQTASAKT
ncbi:integrase core domain protein [Mycobacterium intracellulare MIN_052511_1280]|nr:integrase core domain protein [Mycobacterium intracellulare MIN_052511_1280]